MKKVKVDQHISLLFRLCVFLYGIYAQIQNKRGPRTYYKPGLGSIEVVPIVPSVENIHKLLRDIFENRWQEITFGPLIRGAEYEFVTTTQPKVYFSDGSDGYRNGKGTDGYMTVVFADWHAHVCIGDTKGDGNETETPEIVSQHRKPALVYLYRQLGADGTLNTLGLEIKNGLGEQLLHISKITVDNHISLIFRLRVFLYGIYAQIQNKRGPRTYYKPGLGFVEVFPIVPSVENIHDLLRDIFENHWQETTFGPLIEGAAYEFVATTKPEVHFSDGSLTIAFKDCRARICIDNTKEVYLYRQLGTDGAPNTWGVEIKNDLGEQVLHIALPSPLLTADSKVAYPPNWSRLKLWDELRAEYLNLKPDPKDRTSKGFKHY